VLAALFAAAPQAEAVDTQITIDRTSIDFGSVNVGATAGPTMVTVKNGGSDAFGPINIFGGAPPTNEFNASQNCQGTTLPAGGSCTIDYTFSPGAAGTFNDTSAFTISETPSQTDGEDFSVALHGVGVATTTTTAPTTTTTRPTTTTKPTNTTNRPATSGGTSPATTGAPAIAPLATVAHPEVALGQAQKATGRGFQPQEVVSAVQQPEGLDLGTRVADAGGVVQFSWDVPKSESTGPHEFVATGQKSGSVSATFTVTAAESDGDDSGNGLLIALIAVIVLLAVAAVVFVTYRRTRQAGDHTDTTPQP
jgi:hypothetical protein